MERHIFNARLGYDHPRGALRGLDGFVEFNWLDDLYVNNSNTLEAEGYALWNLNLHYTRALGGGLLDEITAFVEVQNLLDRDYIASANVVADSPGDTPATLFANKQAFFASQERSLYAGIKFGF